MMSINGIGTFNYAVNVVTFKGIGDGHLTDVDHDGRRDLNGIEYTEAPDRILIPRFLGQTASIQSELVLIDLTGGGAFTTTLNFVMFNDNEEPFSLQHSFTCWKRVPLLDISAAFANDFLSGLESNSRNEIAAGRQEAGWIRTTERTATSTARRFTDPAFYAVLVERSGSFAVADLPFEYCSQTNGSPSRRDRRRQPSAV